MVYQVLFLDSSMVEHSAVNRGVVGSSPTRGANLIRPHGQAVKTSPFHGGNMGSNPVGVIAFSSENNTYSSNLCRHGSMAEQLICNQ